MIQRPGSTRRSHTGLRSLTDLLIVVGVGVLAFFVNGYVSAAIMVLTVGGVLGGARVRRRRRAEPARHEGSSHA